MKTLNTTIAAVFSAMIATTVVAEEIPDLSMDKCIEIADFAEEVMTGRQHGAPMEKFLNIDNPPYANYRKMVIGAYNMPRYDTSEYQNDSIEDFRNIGMLACVEAMDARGLN